MREVFEPRLSSVQRLACTKGIKIYEVVVLHHCVAIDALLRRLDAYPEHRLDSCSSNV
jgi:hypothetical protein